MNNPKSDAGKLLIPDTPDDYISDLVLSDKIVDLGECLLVTAWDGTLSIYEIKSEKGDKANYNKSVNLINRGQYENPIICCCVVDSNIYVGTVQGEILRYDIATSQFVSVLQTQEDLANLAICKIFPYRVSGSPSCLICVSWDGSISVVDINKGTVAMRIRLNEGSKILTADCDSNHLIVVETGHRLRLFKFPLRESDEGKSFNSALKYQLRDVKMLPDSKGYIISSIDGRVAVEFFNESEKQFAFRCHRLDLKDTQFVFPVNTLAFCPNSSKVLTGGSDGTVSYWNLETRRKLKQFPKFNSNSVVKLVCDKDEFYVATSDDSFKTNATITNDIDLQPSSIYMVSL